MASKLHLTFDYELFFGTRVGSADRCMLQPTARLLDIGRRFQTPFTLFVDAGMLIAMRREASRWPAVADDLARIRRQLELAVSEGHSVQLHIHPHWEDSVYSDGGWQMCTTRYRLDQFPDNDIHRIIGAYKAELEAVTNKPVYAYRAGGLCVQPFDRVATPLRNNGLFRDSSVYPGGLITTKTHLIDFRDAPRRGCWRFSSDPCKSDDDGYFEEVAISPLRYSQYFFAKMASHRLLKTSRYLGGGDGAGLNGGPPAIARALLCGTNDMASLDGYRVTVLQAAYERHRRTRPAEPFVAIGHPKALSQHSFVVIEALATKFPEAFAGL